MNILLVVFMLHFKKITLKADIAHSVGFPAILPAINLFLLYLVYS